MTGPLVVLVYLLALLVALVAVGAPGAVFGVAVAMAVVGFTAALCAMSNSPRAGAEK